jgi:hypothetical protein
MVLIGSRARINAIFEVRWHTRGKGMLPLEPIKPSGSTQDVRLKLAGYWGNCQLGAMMVLKQSRPVLKVKYLREEIASERNSAPRRARTRTRRGARLGRGLGHRATNDSSTGGLAVLEPFSKLCSPTRMCLRRNPVGPGTYGWLGSTAGNGNGMLGPVSS